MLTTRRDTLKINTLVLKKNLFKPVTLHAYTRII